MITPQWSFLRQGWRQRADRVAATALLASLLFGTAASFGLPPTARPAAGGSDTFGYTWTATAYDWVDASGGQPAGAAGDDVVSGALELGFSFPFYENHYSQVFVSTNGLLTFGQPSSEPANGPVPDTRRPNNTLAVFWDDLVVGAPFNAGRITWLAGGSAPLRIWVVQWETVTRLSGAPSPPLTFQAILHENGDIVYQYQTLAGPLDSATAGIEDETGTDGLEIVHNTPGLSSGLAVRFVRPAPAARIKIFPSIYGSFAGPASPARFEVPLRNAGDLAADTFEVSVAADWPWRLVAPGSTDTLADTNGDGRPDTGPIAPSGRYTLTVLAYPPAGEPAGAHDTISLTVASSLADGVSQTVRLDAARPAAVAQVLQPAPEGAQFQAVTEQGQTVAQPLPAAGRDLALHTAANGSFLVAWRAERCNANCSAWTSELHFQLLDHRGMAVTPAIRLTDHLSATTAVLDLAPAVAATGTGALALTWRRVEYGDLTRSRENIYLALLSAQGALLVPPVNLTQYTAYGTANEAGVPRLGDPRLAATRDNHFVVAWDQRVPEAGGGAAHAILYAVTDAAGALAGAPASFTAGTPTDPAVAEPTLAALSNTQAVLAYNAGGHLSVGVLDSSGAVAQPGTVLSVAGARPEAAALAPGRVLLVWSGAGGVEAAVLGGTPLALTAGPVSLDHPQATGGEAYISATTDEAGRGVITWFDAAASDFNLYYALLDSSGAVLTPPLIWRRGLAGLETSRTGYGNSDYPRTGLSRLWLPLVTR